MDYHAQSKRFTVSMRDLEGATAGLYCAIRHIRKLEGLPMAPYKRDGALTGADFAQKAILDAAKSLGIDMGAEWGNVLDLSRYDD